MLQAGTGLGAADVAVQFTAHTCIHSMKGDMQQTLWVT